MNTPPQGSEKDPKPGLYQHYKGGVYEVLTLAYSSETLEELVVYRATYDSPDFPLGVWVRPRQMFLQMIELNGKSVPRFRRIEP